MTAAGFRSLADLELPALEAIYVLCSDKLTDEAVESIASIKSLRVVHLPQCGPFSRRGVEALSALPRLQILDIRGNAQIADDCLPALLMIGQDLSLLRVTGTGLSGQALAKLAEVYGSEVVDTNERRWAHDRQDASRAATE